jgi:glycosyltransferase involved in cell wall biosynthesis
MIHTNKLTVMQVLPALEFGGVERGTLEIASALVKRGHRSIVVSAGGRMVPKLQDEGSEHLLLPVGQKSPFSLRFIPALKTSFRSSNVDIIHVRSRFPAWLCYLALRGWKSTPRPRFITTVHGVYSVSRYSSIMVRGEKVIAISNFVRNYILDNYPETPPENIHVIPRGVEPEIYDYDFKADSDWLQSWFEQYPETRHKKLIALPGRITRRKGHEDFVEIFKLLKANHELHGLIIGGSATGKQQYISSLKSMIDDSGLIDRITMIGHRDDVREIYRLCDVVLSLSKEPEAFGRTSLEALSLGVPVIAYNHGGAGEVLRNIFPSGLVPVGNHKQTAGLILEFVNRPPVVPPQQKYILQKMQDETLDLYESLVCD